MTLLLDVTEFNLIGVFDRGVPSKERVVFKTNQPIDIGNYAIFVGMRVAAPGNLVVPLRDNMFWFGSALLNPNDWIFLYTGHGAPMNFPADDGSGHVYTTYWGRNQTMFHDPQIVPAIVRLGGILVEARPKPAPQPAASFLTRAK